MTPVPKRRWFRWSLRTLFVAVTVFAAMSAYLRHRAQVRHAARQRPGAEAEMLSRNATAPLKRGVSSKNGEPNGG